MGKRKWGGGRKGKGKRKDDVGEGGGEEEVVSGGREKERSEAGKGR